LDTIYAIMSEKFGFDYYNVSRFYLGKKGEDERANVPIGVNLPLVRGYLEVTIGCVHCGPYGKYLKVALKKYSLAREVLDLLE